MSIGATRALLVALIASGLTPAALSAGRPRTRIYVFTAQQPGATPSAEELGRLDSVRDLQESLSHKSEFTLVQTADDAQVVVEVLNREERDVPAGGFGGKSLTRPRETIVRVRVRFGATESDLKGVGRPSWGAAAKDVAKRLSTWVKNHRIAA
jgi:hypothetical protein